MSRVKQVYPLVLMVLLSLSFGACDNSEKAVKASSSGSPSEIIVVAENNLWATSLGDSIRTFFDSSRPGLPQPEPLYKTVQIKLSEFQRLFQTHRNVLVIAIDSSLTQPNTEIAYNVWAEPQRVAKITAPTIEMLKDAFNEKKREIFNLYENAEIERLQDLYSKTLNIKAVEAVRAKFNIDLKIPGDYFVAVEKENFIWLRREANTLSQGLIIYAYPYTDTVAFNPLKIRSVRNQFTNLYIPGPSESSYMTIADSDIPLITRTLDLKGELAIETRGLWEVEKDFMGGPFVNYTFVDKNSNMVLALDGYVYAPNANKTALLKQVQSILLSFKYHE